MSGEIVAKKSTPTLTRREMSMRMQIESLDRRHKKAHNNGKKRRIMRELVERRKELKAY